MSKQPSRVVQENIDALIERERVGRIEHGDDMDRTDFPVEAWLAELISESLDSANYGRKLQHMLPKLVAAAKRLEGMGFAWADGSWQAPKHCLSADEVNALPERVRKYIMWLETNADPGHTMQDNFRLAEENAALRAMLAEQPAAAQEAVAWQRKYLGATRGGRPVDWHNITREKFEQTKSGKWADKYDVRELFAAPVAAAPVDGRDVRSAIAGLEGSVAVGSDGEWVSVRRAARDAAVMALRNVSLDCAHIYAAYSEAKASTPAAPGIDLSEHHVAVLRDMREHMANRTMSLNDWDKLGTAAIDAVLALIDASRKGGDAQDAARYRWLRKHFRFANDSLRELWFDPAIDPNDGGVPEDLDQEIDRTMSNAHSAEVGS